jgi:hypothetical protein
MPEALPSSSVELELAIRGKIAAKLQAVDSTWKVQSRPRYVVGDKAWLSAAASTVAGKYETRGAFVSFKGFGDDDESTPCNQTELTLNYEIDVFTSVVDSRVDNSNSHGDFVSFLMRARDAFNADRHFGYSSKVEHQFLRTENPARVEEMDGATVHRINLSLAVVIDL